MPEQLDILKQILETMEAMCLLGQRIEARLDNLESWAESASDPDRVEQIFERLPRA